MDDQPWQRWLQVQQRTVAPSNISIELKSAVRTGDVDFLLSKYPHYPKYAADVWRWAAQKGDISLLEVLHGMDPVPAWSQKTTETAADNIRVLRWLRERDPPCPWGLEMWTAAVRCENFQVLSYLKNSNLPLFDREPLWTIAISTGRCGVLRQLFDVVPLDASPTICLASPSKMVDTWLRTHGCSAVQDTLFDSCACWLGCNGAYRQRIRDKDVCICGARVGTCCVLAYRCEECIDYTGDDSGDDSDDEYDSDSEYDGCPHSRTSILSCAVCVREVPDFRETQERPNGMGRFTYAHIQPESDVTDWWSIEGLSATPAIGVKPAKH